VNRCAAGLFLTLAASAALAQTAPPATAPVTPAAATEDVGKAVKLEAVQVTGSRIAAPNNTSTSPIVTVTAEEIKNGGRLDVSDILNQLPQITSNSLGQGLGNKTSGLTSAGGVANADLRGLGPGRTLVLVNGRRLGNGSPQTVIASPAPDLDQIPSALIKSVDVVTGGASTVYGSDAIAGVVNFITRRDFEGLEVGGQIGSNWHDNNNSFAQDRLDAKGYDYKKGTTWDGKTVDLNMTMGANLLDGRGNVTAFFGYRAMDPVRSSERDFGSCQLSYNADLDDVACGGSSNSNYFKPSNETTNPDGTVYSVSGSEFITRGSAPTTPPAVFNSQKSIYMQREDTRYNAGFLANVDVNQYVKPYAEFMFMNDRTHQEVAPTALFRGSNPFTATGNYLINCSNPLLSASQAAALCTPQQIADDQANPGSVSADVEIGRRNLEGGGRTYEYEHSNYRVVLGTKGTLAKGVDYDLYGQYYYTNFNNINGKDFTFDKVVNSLQVTGTADNPVCISGGNCVPYNIFQDGKVTDAALNYLYTPGTASGNTDLRTLHLDISADLGLYGIKLPTAEDGVGVNVGYERRTDGVNYAPDAATVGGLIVGAGGASPAIDRTNTVKELFGEVRVPIARGMPGIYDLVADAGYRHSKYELSGGVDTYKFELQYAPVADVRLRGSYNRAIRAPNLIELYNPQLVGKVSFGEDPCAPSETDGTLAATFEQCARTGVTQAQYDNASIPQGTAGQLTQLQGGNPDLKPESADTYSVGMTLQPSAIKDFTASIDFYQIKLKDTVGAIPLALILNNCLTTGDDVFCSQLVRNPATGSLNGASVASGGYIKQTSVNIGATKLEGIDVQAGYRMRLPENYGRLRFNLNGAYLLSSESTPIAGGDSYDCSGLFGATCQTVNPKWRHNFRTSWDITKTVTVNATWRYLGKVKQDNNEANVLLKNPALGADAIFRAKIQAVNYLDLAASWGITKQLEIRGGINNILDRDPPIVPSDIASGGAPNYYEYYDGLGRQLFAAANYRF